MQTAISHKTTLNSFRNEAIDVISVGIRQRNAINMVKRLPMPDEQLEVVMIFTAYRHTWREERFAAFIVKHADTLIAIMPASNPPALYRLKVLIAQSKQLLNTQQ